MKRSTLRRIREKLMGLSDVELTHTEGWLGWLDASAPRLFSHDVTDLPELAEADRRKARTIGAPRRRRDDRAGG